MDPTFQPDKFPEGTAYDGEAISKSAESQKMSARPYTNVITNEQALAAFVARKHEIDTMLARLQAHSDEHFGLSPDEITWGHVTALADYAGLLKRITDSTFKEGEYADAPAS